MQQKGAARMNKPIVFHGIIEKEGNQYSAVCLEMEVATCGDTLKEANLKEAMAGFVEIGLEQGDLEDFLITDTDGPSATVSGTYRSTYHSQLMR